MFTGIIESQAVLTGRKVFKRGARLTFQVLGRRTRFRRGESVALDGVCLTLTNFRGKNFSADLISETIKATTLGKLSPGVRVNFERSLRAGDRVGGHWVTGHVDGMGRIQKMERRGRGLRLKIKAPADIMRFLVSKGSIAVDGISFTLQKVGRRSFVLGVTPHTYRTTSLQFKRTGSAVNLEIDLFARLVRRFLSNKRR